MTLRSQSTAWRPRWSRRQWTGITIFALLITWAGLAAPRQAAIAAGALTPGQEFGSDAAMIVTGDLNGDGALDLVTDTQVFFNDGAGQLLAGPTFPRATAVAVGDLDGDGALDLVTGDFEQSVIRLNDGRGALLAPRPFGRPDADPMAFALGDMNGDGALDIVAAVSVQGVR